VRAYGLTKKKSKNKSDTFSADAYLQRSCGQRRFEKKKAIFWVEYLRRRCGLAGKKKKKKENSKERKKMTKKKSNLGGISAEELWAAELH